MRVLPDVESGGESGRVDEGVMVVEDGSSGGVEGSDSIGGTVS